MVFPSIISVIPPTVCFVLAIYVSYQCWNDKGIKVFSALLLVLAAYGVVQVIIQSRQDINEAAYLSEIKTAFWGLIAPLSYQTVIMLMKERKQIWIFTLIYLYVFGLVLIILSLSGYSIYKGYFLASWGLGAEMNFGSWFFWAFHTYLVSGVAALIITLFAVREHTENYRVQKLASAILINFIWGGIFVILPYTIFSWFKMPAEIFLAYAGNAAMFLIVFAILKYRPEKFSAGTLLSSLTSLLPAEALVITPDKKILWLSRNKILISGFTRKDLEGADYGKLFANTALIDEELDKIKIKDDYSASFETQCNTLNGTNPNVKISISGLRNEFNDVLAFLVVFNKQVDNIDLLNYLQSSYELSDREKDVAVLLLEECSNIQISDRLFISLNTVKTHTRNIYQKTNTTNRAEFKNFCRNLTVTDFKFK